MRKTSHWLIAKRLSDQYAIKGVSRFLFIFGNLYPDLVPTFAVKYHTFDRWYPWVDLNLHQFRGWFTAGRVVHLCCDFFTRPHNELHMLNTKHIHWEKSLDKLLRSKSCFVPRYGDVSLSDLHDMYMHADVSIWSDYIFICRSCSLVMPMILEAGANGKCSRSE